MAAVPAPAAPSSTGEKYFSCLKKKRKKEKAKRSQRGLRALPLSGTCAELRAADTVSWALWKRCSGRSRQGGSPWVGAEGGRSRPTGRWGPRGGRRDPRWQPVGRGRTDPHAQCIGPAPEPGAGAPFPAPSAFVSPL